MGILLNEITQILIDLNHIQRTALAFRFIIMRASSNNALRFKEIHHLNEALLVMRHFITLSARLLPFLSELQQKKHPTSTEITNIHKITEVYENYNFDTNVSEMLLNSNILELIKDSFERISDSSHHKNREANRRLNHFLNEYNRLMEKWGEINAN